MQVAGRCDARTSLLLSLLVLLLGPPAAPGAWAADGLFSHLRETVRRSWQERTALLRANLDSLQPHSAAAHHYNIVGSSELDWVVFSGIGLEEGGPRHFDERDLKLVRRRRPQAAEHGETWLQALAWRKIVESQAADASDIDTHGHSTALDVIHGAFRNGFSVVINMAIRGIRGIILTIIRIAETTTSRLGAISARNRLAIARMRNALIVIVNMSIANNNANTDVQHVTLVILTAIIIVVAVIVAIVTIASVCR